MLRRALSLALLISQGASFAHLAIADHVLSSAGHLVEAPSHSHAHPEGLGQGEAGDARCVVFDAITVPAELLALAVDPQSLPSSQLPAGNVRRGFVRSALIDAPKASPPSRG